MLDLSLASLVWALAFAVLFQWRLIYALFVLCVGLFAGPLSLALAPTLWLPVEGILLVSALMQGRPVRVAGGGRNG